MFNLFGIAFFGYYVETAVGRRGLLMSFFLAGILSKSGTILTIPAHAASMGASAAIMGVLGFLAVIDPLHPVRFFTILHHPAISFVIIFGVLNLIGLFYPAGPIGYAAHLSGLIVGILLGIHWRNIKKIKIE
jgi:membrane associated rhomboid family serine protease